MQRIGNPLPIFTDTFGNAVDGGYIYIGTPNLDPEAAPVAVYLDRSLTQAIPQPLRTIGGYIVNGRTPVACYTAADDYSIRVRDAALNEVFYQASILVDVIAYQPVDSDLTAIAALATTSFGRALLTLANADALKSATGIPDCLPLSGGTITGNVIRASSGAHLYHAGSANVSGRVFVTDSAASDPTSLEGDIWIKTE